MEITWGPNWEDDLAGVTETGTGDVNFRGLEASAYLQFKRVFMLYLPRLCEHCLNPACVASCPSGALYKREEDGIVLVDQERCRGWRFCVSGCPYKKTYFNWKTGRAEKCLFCYPRTEAGLPTLCAHSCVGRIRTIGVLLYDSDRIREAASATDPKDLYPAQLDLLLDPYDAKIIAEAGRQGIPENWLAAARRSPVYRLIKEWCIALPLHPEFRTLPMVWYVPPLSPISAAVDARGVDPAIDSLRIPVAYLANLLTAGDEGPVRLALKRLAALRVHMRADRLKEPADPAVLEAVGLTTEVAAEMYRLLALAYYLERFVLPTTGRVDETASYIHQGRCGYP
jgi:nitrate reductase beta subunit